MIPKQSFSYHLHLRIHFLNKSYIFLYCKTNKLCILILQNCSNLFTLFKILPFLGSFPSIKIVPVLVLHKKMGLAHSYNELMSISLNHFAQQSALFPRIYMKCNVFNSRLRCMLILKVELFKRNNWLHVNIPTFQFLNVYVSY